ncbi:MAG: hypothetical protein LBP34_00940 [Flavobacteriaceae bacterium]|jgi:hypothetical protein|nr:hypothetical protein [Flavobacteriaceae bacterium]
MKKTFLLITIILFIPVFSYSQDINFKIIAKDKQEYTGVMKRFKIKSGSKKIKIPTENGKIALLSKDLTDIYVWTTSGKAHLVHMPYKMIFKNKVLNRRAFWSVNVITTPKLNLYEAGQIYQMRNSYLLIKSSGQKGFVGMNYFFKRPNEESLVYIGDDSPVVNPNVFLRQMARNYFSDCPDLAEKIMEREFRFKDREKIIDYYNSQCK